MIDFAAFIYFGGSLAFAAYIIPKMLDYSKSRANSQIRARNEGNFVKTGNPVSSIIVNSEQIIDQLHKLRAEQIQKGATPESLKPLDDRLRQLEWVGKNRFWLEPIAPFADEIAGIILKSVKGLLR